MATKKHFGQIKQPWDSDNPGTCTWCRGPFTDDETRVVIGMTTRYTRTAHTAPRNWLEVYHADCWHDIQIDRSEPDYEQE